MTLRVLIVGGYGTFGGRLVRLLADEPGFTVLVGGRSLAKAKTFCAQVSGSATLLPVVFDRSGDVAAQLTALAPDILVDASGPFQAYRDDPYAVVKACIAKHVHYLDLADGAAFVGGVAQFDALAREAGVFVLSGVSTFPVLSSAVVQRLAGGLARVHDIAAGIAPSPHAGIGLNVTGAIVSYAGKRVTVWRDGHTATAYGMLGTRRFTIAPPGFVPLKARRFALVEVPDLVLAPKLWPGARSVWTGAGTEPAIWLRGLSLMAAMVRLHMLPSLSPFSKLFHWVGNRLVWGARRGGMFVEVRGTASDGSAVTHTWHMIAEGDEGPFVPAIGVFAILTRLLGGRAPVAGARACVSEIELEDYERVFARHNIVTGVRACEGSSHTLPLYRRFFGSAWDALPEPIRTLHDGIGMWQVEGRACVERGRSILARIAAAVIGFPQAGDDVPVSVRFDSVGGRETWTRTFAGKAFSSVQFAGRGRYEGLICERFGPLTFAMAMIISDGKLHLVQRGWSAFGIPLPMFLAPAGNTFESAEDGRFHFHVEIGFPWTGLIVRYRGWLARRS